MSTTLPSLENMPTAEQFREINKFTLALYRLGLGRLMWEYPRFMVLVHRGRKSGIKRYTPVTSAQIGGDLFCMAGFGPRTQWYKNVLAHPQIEVWTGDLRRTAIAERVADEDEAMAAARQLLTNAGPVGEAWIQQNPATAPDSLMREVVRHYPITRIRVTGSAPPADPGEPQPGDLQWLWGALVLAVAALAVAVLFLLRPRRK